ncbi:MAG: ABC transporter ATP-binding protein [Candidatus Beckwithbacteria bacterium]
MTNTNHQTAIKIDQVSKTFHVGVQDVQVLKDITLEIKSGDFAVIFGPSGCGKSTLLHIILGLEEPTSGKISILGQNLYGQWDEDERANFRKQKIGMVYQQPRWIRALNVVENVAFPLSLLGGDKAVGLNKAMEVLKLVNMTEWANYFPSELSSGQQQKVALSRALITNPEILIADEPTGNLDYESGQELMELLNGLNQKANKTFLMVTHDLEYIKFAKTTVEMFDGQIKNVYQGKDKHQLLNKLPTKRG